MCTDPTNYPNSKIILIHFDVLIQGITRCFFRYLIFKEKYLRLEFKISQKLIQILGLGLHFYRALGYLKGYATLISGKIRGKKLNGSN